jgi:transcriptional regulator with XRE-family HTH domain
MDFWMRLKIEIKAKNTTQEWISDKIGVPFGTFRKWMSRKTYPNIKEGIEIAKLLETTAEYLVTGEKKENQATDIEPMDLNEAERELIYSYRRLNSTDKENAILTINAWTTKYVRR